MTYVDPALSSLKGAASARRRRDTEIDRQIGGRLRALRTLRRWSQGKLGAAVGLSYAQIQKYESGANPVSASRLLKFCHLLNAPITYFFDELESTVWPLNPRDCLHAVRMEGKV